MSARTAPLHSPAELTLATCDDITAIVAFVAPSASTPGKYNTVSLDTATGAIHCDCKGAECGRECWHRDLVAAAWAQSPAMREVAWLSDARLARYGAKLAGMVVQYRARTGRALALDVVNLLAARAEWRRRAAAAPAPVAARFQDGIGHTPALAA